MKTTPKKLFALALALAMLLSLPLFVSAEEGSGDVVEVIREDNTSLGTYPSVVTAFQAANKERLDNYTVKLLDNLELTSTLAITNANAATYTIDGNGKSIIQDQGITALQIKGNKDAVVNIKDLRINSYGAAIEFHSGTLNLLSGYYYSDCDTGVNDGYGVATVYIKSAITGADGVCKFNMYGGTIVREHKNNEATAALNIDNAMEAGAFEANIYGGYVLSDCDRAMMVCNYSKCNIYGGTFYTSKASNGYALMGNHAKPANDVKIYGGNFIVPANADVPPVRNNKAGGLMTVTGGNFMGGVSAFRDKNNDDADIAYPAGENCYSVGNTVPVMTAGAAVRYAAGSMGIGFASTISQATVTALKALADENTELKFGALICEADDLEKLPYMSRDTLDSIDALYADVRSEVADTTAETVTIRSALTNVKAAYKATKFAAIPYIAVTVNGAEVYFYGMYNAANAYSMAEIATLALADVVDASAEGYTNLVADSSAQNGKYSPYTAEQRAAMAAYLQ